MTLHVPAESVNNYKNHEVWSKFKAILPLNEEEMGIGQATMMNGTGSATVIYDLNGHRQIGLKKGLNVIRTADGRTMKVGVTNDVACESF